MTIVWSRRVWSLSGQSWSVILTTSRGQVLQESNYCRRSFRQQCRNLAKVPSVKNQERSWNHKTVQNESPNHRWKITDGRYQCNVHMFYLYEECLKPGACIHDHLWFQLYQSCPGDRVLLRTKPKEKLDEVLALKAALEQTDIRDSMRLLRFYDSCFLGRLVYDLWQFMIIYGSLSEARLTMHKWKKDGSTYLPLSKQLRVLWGKPRGNAPYRCSSGKTAEAQDHRWEQKSTGLRFGRNIKTPDIKIYSRSYIHTKINKQILYDKLHKKCSAEVQSVVSPRSRMLQGLVGFPACSSSNPCKTGANRWGRPPGSTRAFSQILSSGWKRGSQS